MSKLAAALGVRAISFVTSQALSSLIFSLLSGSHSTRKGQFGCFSTEQQRKEECTNILDAFWTIGVSVRVGNSG